MKRIAVIDLGTNTFHLLITETKNPVIPGNIWKETIAVKLGEGGINQGVIHPDAFLRGIKAMEKFHQLIAKYQANEIKAVATAAIRKATNGADFIVEVKKRTGLTIEMIDGEEEARLIYAGVREGVKMGGETSLIMDIGGGSVEFILCNSSEIFWKKSYLLGAAIMMDRFHHSDPISEENIQQFMRHLDETLIELGTQCLKHQPQTLIGSAGAFETFAELVKRRFNPGDADPYLPEREINLEHFHVIAATLLRSTHQERSKMPGLIALRVDMIVVATILTQHMISKLDVNKLVLSSYSLKEGVLFDILS